MKFFVSLTILIFLNYHAYADLIKPSPNISPEEVISIQLSALQNNNFPYIDAGIHQTWEFAHPDNRIFTGPLSNFISMMRSSTYIIMLDHIDHKIIPVKEKNNIKFYFVEIQDKKGDRYGFQWSVKKVLSDIIFKNCWMTSSVSPPYALPKEI
tara:strand:- start:11 stop:469 length:459 start_codon:yes stop_codon:yes gene_type:complete